jgi:hypothetical protein
VVEVWMEEKEGKGERRLWCLLVVVVVVVVLEV